MRRMRRVRSLLRRLARRPRRCPFRRATGLAGLKNCNPFDDQPGCYALLLPRGFHARRVGLMDEMQEITREFLIESNDQVDEMDSILIELEKTPDSKDLLSTIFRAIHTIKGSSGTLGYKNIERLSHAGESLLSLMRDGRLRIDTDSATWLLAMNDAIRRMLTSIETTGTEGPTRTQAII